MSETRDGLRGAGSLVDSFIKAGARLLIGTGINFIIEEWNRLKID